MTTETNMPSVLAKLMNIGTPSILYATHQRRHRVLSENYLQNIASVTTKREKDSPFSDSDFETNVAEDFIFRTRNSVHDRKPLSFSSSSSVDQKRMNSLNVERSNGMLLQKKRLSSSCNRLESSSRSSVSSQEIAKQITGQVKHSIWHSCAELSTSGPRSEMSSDNDKEDRTTLFTHSFDSGKKHEAQSYSSVKRSTSIVTQKAEKQLSERWRLRKCSEEVRMSHGRKVQDKAFVISNGGSALVTNTKNGSFHSPYYTTNVKWYPILRARYLSKPALFPFAWVPRSKSKHFTLEKNWSPRLGKVVSKQCVDSKEDYKEVQSISESSILNDSVNLADKNSCEETFKGSLSNYSEFLDVASPTFHEAQIVPDEKGASHFEKVDSQNNAFESLPSNCSLAPLSLETEGVTDDGNEQMTLSIKYRRENLLGDDESFKCQLKLNNNDYKPRSPVSSLEGPEDCIHTLNLIVGAAQHLSVSDCLEKDAQGLNKKLQLIETMSLESGSDGPEMMVSSDEGDDGYSVGFYQNDPQIIGIYQTFVKECWDFSYVVDAVVESGLETRNLEIEGKILQDYGINPLVFDSLEKKYGKSMPWEKSERRLLFDRLSSVLLEIVTPSVCLNTWRQPVAKRFHPRDRNLELTEELWSMLVKQQQELKRESSDEVCKREIEWLDLEADTNLIVQEIERLLLDEVVEEFVSLEIYSF